MPLPPLLQSFLTPNTQPKAPLLGQEARNQDMSGLMNAMQMPASAAGPALQSQQMQMQNPAPQQSAPYQGPTDGYGEPTTDIPGLPPLNNKESESEGVLPPIGAIQLPQGQTQNQSLPMNGTIQQHPMGMSSQTNQTNPYVDDRRWGGLIGGGVNHPNGLIRMSQGYENGGLAGAIGYLMSNMDKQQIR